MADAPRDSNFVPANLFTSSGDGVSTVRAYADPTTRRQLVDATTDAAPTTYIVADGTRLTTGTNVAIQLTTTATTCQKVVIYAYVSNKDAVAVGTSTVIAESNSTGTKTGRGEQLNQGAATAVYVSDASKIWISSVVNGDGVSYAAYK